MKRIFLSAALAAGVMAALPVGASEARDEGQAELARLLDGRVAGEPQSCVRTMPSTQLRIIEGTAIVVGRGNTIYVNVPRHPDSLDEDDAMKIRRTSSQLCRTDIVTTFDRTGGIYTGNIFLGDFVPYKKTDS